MNIRAIEPTEYDAMANFLYHAIFVPPGKDALPREVIEKPEITIYIDGFGEEDDCGVVCELDGRIVGAAWVRIIHAFGYVDEETPELAISVLPEYRNQGIGAGLMQELFGLLTERGYRQTSLSVQKENPAVRFYQRLGYVTVRVSDEDFIMVKDLGKCN